MQIDGFSILNSIEHAFASFCDLHGVSDMIMVNEFKIKPNKINSCVGSITYFFIWQKARLVNVERVGCHIFFIALNIITL